MRISTPKSFRPGLIMVCMLLAGIILSAFTFQQSQTPSLLQIPTPCGPEAAAPENAIHGLYFFRYDCPHCQAILTDLIQPLQEQYGAVLDIRLLEVTTPDYYELLIAAEEYFQIAPQDRAFPTLVMGEEVLIGEDAIRSRLPEIISESSSSCGLAWPALPNFDGSSLINSDPMAIPVASCETNTTDSCLQTEPIYLAYFYQTGCQICSRVEADLDYLRTQYPNIIIEEFNIFDQAALGEWLAERAGRSGDFLSPAIFIGDQAWIGETEITPQALDAALTDLAQSGSPRTWDAFDPSQTTEEVVGRFQSMGWLTVAFAGLVDGLNPCAFATLVFFVSYLTISGKKGKEVLLVGGAFTLGVFIAYLVIGFGFYRVLDLMGGWLQVLSRWVYGLTALLCLVLAVFSFLDFVKARRGEISDMSLNLPHALRMRINATIREGRSARGYAFGAFVSGIVISFLELACTGQIYLPTIIFVSSIPELRLQAAGYLILYNLLFILPLIVVFILAFYGTTSRDLSAFLQRNAANVKLGMVMLFLSLAAWLGLSLLG